MKAGAGGPAPGLEPPAASEGRERDRGFRAGRLTGVWDGAKLMTETGLVRGLLHAENPPMNSREDELCMLLEIRERGDVLGRVLSHCQAEAERLAERYAGRDVHFVGCGDMYFAAAAVEAALSAGGDLLETMLCEVIALQLLTAHGVSAMGRDPNRWLGGRRTDAVQAMSQETIRGSRTWRPEGWGDRR